MNRNRSARAFAAATVDGIDELMVHGASRVSELKLKNFNNFVLRDRGFCAQSSADSRTDHCYA